MYQCIISHRGLPPAQQHTYYLAKLTKNSDKPLIPTPQIYIKYKTSKTIISNYL